MNTKVILNLLQNFILGGALIALVSYIGTFVNPVLGAIIWSFPFSLIPTLYFMKWQNRKNSYISKFAFMGSLTIALEFIATYFIARFINQQGEYILTIAIFKSLVIWGIAGLIFYKMVYRYNLQDKFV